MILFAWWNVVPCRRITLTSMLYFVNQPAPERSVVVLCIATPLFDLRHIYRILTVPFSIYMLFTGFWQSSFFHLHHIYRNLTVSLFQFTTYLQYLESLLFSIYMLFTCYLQVQIEKCTWHLHDPWKHVKVQKPCTLSSQLFSQDLHVIYIACKFSTFSVNIVLKLSYWSTKWRYFKKCHAMDNDL